MRSLCRLVPFLTLLAVPTLTTLHAQEWRGPVAVEVQAEDSRGRNLSGAEVRLVYLDPAGGGALPSVLTDPAGQANISGLAAGRWTLEVRHPGFMTYRAEITLAADRKPTVESATQEMAPGATSTMRVKLQKGRPGAPPPAPAPRVAPPKPPTAPPASAAAPVLPRQEAPKPVATPAPTQPVPASAAPVAPPAKPPVVTPEAAPTPAPPVASEPEPVPKVVPPPVDEKPAAPLAPVASVMEPAPVSPPPTPAPAVAPAPAVPPAPAPTAVPAPAPASAVELGVAPAVQAPRAPAPTAAAAPARQRLCIECPPGESAAWGEATIEGGATSGCPADLAVRLRSQRLDSEMPESDLGPGCRVIRVDLPAGARFTGFRFEARSAGVTADCLPGRECPAGQALFPFEPVIRSEGNRTTLLVAFESTAPDRRSALVAGYSTYNKKK